MKTFAQVCALLVLVSLACQSSAFGSITIQVFASSAPNGYGSPSWSSYVANALNSLENGLGNIGNRNTDPTAYEIAGPYVDPGEFMVSSFYSWRGEVGPASPFANEYGNRMHFGLHAFGDGTTQFDLEDLTFSIHSSDPGDVMLFVGDFVGYNYSSTRTGINWGADRLRGTADDIRYTSGNGTTLVDELVYVGVGNAFWPGGDDPNPGNPAGGAQAAMDAAYAWVYSNVAFTMTGTYYIKGYSGSDSVAVVPAPPALLLGALGVGLVALLRRRFRK